MPRAAGALVSFALMQLGWFACVLGAAHGLGWIGPLAVAAGLLVHLSRTTEKRGESILLVASAAVGAVVDTSLLRVGVLRIPGAVIAPVWLVALWPNFAASTGDDGALRGLRRRPIVAALVGAVGGPLAYDGGARLGALALGSDRAVSLVVIGIVWAALVSALFAARRVATAR